MPNTIGISHGVIKMDLQVGFPLLTTKKMYLKGIIHELLWFLRGDTNIKYLVDNNVHIWDQDAYRWYLKQTEKAPCEDFKPMSFEEFIDAIKNTKGYIGDDPYYRLGDLGKVYGYQWRGQNGVDQIKECLEGLQTNPYSRYHIIDGWNKADFKDMALPPCHLLYQFIVRPIDDKLRYNNYAFDFLVVDVDGTLGLKQTFEEFINDTDSIKNYPKFYLDLNMYQRSCDTFLGVPFNIASMSLLNMIFAKACNMLPGVATWIGGDTHLYVNHMEQVKEQLSREPKELPLMIIKKDIKTLEDIETLTIDDFELMGYESHSAIKAELSTGLKK